MRPSSWAGLQEGISQLAAVFSLGEGAFCRWVLVELAQCFVRVQGSVGGVEEPGESECEG